MSKFVVKNIEEVKGIQQFKQLIIVDNSVDVDRLQLEIDEKEQNGKEVDLVGVLDEYESSLEVKYTSSFFGILAIMNRVANLQAVGETKFKDVTPSGEVIKEFEFKFQDLRVLAIKIPNGKLVLLAGYKNNQKKDFSRFHSLKQQYLKTLNNKK